jgi:hypothetical protein
MIEVLKQALEALKLALRSHGVMLLSDPPQDAWKTYGVDGNARQAIASLRQAIAELESQEPVAWLRTSGIGSPVVTNEMFNAYPEMRLNFQTPLYTHPPQRTWVGLTKDKVDSWNLPDHPTVFEFAQFIEAKLKEKNT